MKRNVKVMYRWLMYAEYADGFRTNVGGYDEDDCMADIFDLMDEHGECTFYTGVSDEDYECGEYIGRENFIYE
ncbi:MAG: hypothetical protein LUD50_02550 [Clostridia bacterium]|nr:hypothetical protein [Clostridia bacterium]